MDFLYPNLTVYLIPMTKIYKTGIEKKKAQKNKTDKLRIIIEDRNRSKTTMKIRKV